MAAVRVLFIAAEDVGASLAHLAYALRRTGKAQARVVVANRDPVAGWSEDIVEPVDGGAEARHLLAHADALHLVDIDPTTAELFGRPLRGAAERIPGGVIQIDRAPRSAWPGLEDAAISRGWALVTTRADVADATRATLLAPFVPLGRAPWVPLAPGTRMRESVRRPAVVFASSRIPFRRRPALERLVDAADDMVRGGQLLETVVGRPQHQVLRKRRFAHLTLCSSNRGLHTLATSAFESLAQGVAVVTDSAPEALERYATLAGAPAPVLGVDGLDAAVAAMQARGDGDPQLRAWAERAMNPARWLEACTVAYARTRRAA